ncbi:MAG: 50S ribosomal protein L6 [Candidatus Niyogibacteria bacterium]|nr:50S ribosomal protein L6 [Candidatus Niyogibacteria bacterium]
MSRIGKNPIKIPAGVTVTIKDGGVKIKGPKGELARDFLKEIKIEAMDGKINLRIDKMTKNSSALWGTYASHIKNMIEGVTDGFQKKLEIEGIGYRVKLEGEKLILSLGFSHPIEVKKPAGVDFQIEKNKIIISGSDKELVGQTAANIRALKKAEPYKGKGIRYEGEVIRRKTGKKAAATA